MDLSGLLSARRPVAGASAKTDRLSPGGEYAHAVGVIALVTAGCLIFRSHLNPTDVAMVFLLAVVFVASRYHLGPALAASLLSIAAFDFTFVPPYYTFDVHDRAYFLTFGVMLAVALIMSRLTARIRDQREEARERERRTAALYAMSQQLGGAGSRGDVVTITARHIGQAGGGEAVVILAEDLDTEAARPAWPTDGVLASVGVRVAAQWVYERGQPAGCGTARCAEAEAFVVPLKTPTRTLGVVVLSPEPPQRIPAEEERSNVETLAEQAAVALERTILAERHEQARLEVEAEHLRTSLLSSLSHDLRTPLGSIEGSASSLLQDGGSLPPDVRQELAETILEESRRMTRLVTNLLDMVRVETGNLAVQKAWQPLEEVLGVALLRLDERLKNHPVETRLRGDLPLVPVDELLLEQVFINLLENAVKYTPIGTPITVGAWAQDGAVVVEVADRGPGVPPGEEEVIFHKFYRSSQGDHAGPAGGAGLGLTICRAIVNAHGGRMWMEPGAGGGAAFRFTLPLEGPPLKPVPAEASEA